MTKTFKFAGYKDKINVAGVGMVYATKGCRPHRRYISIATHPIENFFRKILGLPMRKPHRSALYDLDRWLPASVVVNIYGKEERYYFKSNEAAHKEACRLLTEMEAASASSASTTLDTVYDVYDRLEDLLGGFDSKTQEAMTQVLSEYAVKKNTQQGEPK